MIIRTALFGVGLSLLMNVAGMTRSLAGARDNGAPALRPTYHPNYYGAFVLDPDGYNIEAVCHNPV